METKAVVKKGTDTLIKYGSAGAGLAAGYLVASKLPVPAAGPVWLQTILQTLAPGVLVMLAAYMANKKFNDSKNENIEAAALGMGLAGLAVI
ncbi:MAG: hypothetical protein HOP30_19555, partial [Cyclobacteriaceae bacterium]|nr:hypothetical protein [Cyclobacteriaceae bacterium]